MATKESKRQVRELVEALEQRVHAGPVIQGTEIQTARDFLCRNDFPPASDYFNRLMHIENRLQQRAPVIHRSPTKRNYGGKAAGYQMQVQSIYDHLILSICYEGDFNTKHGRIKISHRFNREGRIDFVELKYLRSLHPLLNGEVRKLLTVNNYSSIRKDWFEAEACVLRVLPQELIFLYKDIFRCPKPQLFAWLVNIGHGIVSDLVEDLKAGRTNGVHPPVPSLDASGISAPNLCWSNGAEHQNGNGSAYRNGNGQAVCLAEKPNGNGLAVRDGNGFTGSSSRPTGYSEQLHLDALVQDGVAMPILEKAAGLESVVEMINHTDAVVRYLRKSRF